jgi:predicted SAM-dependent methyltransferase
VRKLHYLNVGCGSKFHRDWINIDMRSADPDVQAHNLLSGFPYRDDQFEVVYHSQVLEHFPKERAADFLKECLRVLRPGGILRVVVPDLENIAAEYLRQLRENIEHPTERSMTNYEWILLEMYDQSVRTYSGGQMAKFLQRQDLPNEDYVIGRIGHVARALIEEGRKTSQGAPPSEIVGRLRKMTVGKLLRHGFSKARSVFSTKSGKLGAFRLGGEIHMWMYDRFSLSTLLTQVGFRDIARLDAFTSAIPAWSRFELDVKDGAVFDPASLFMEARKPATPSTPACR